MKQARLSPLSGRAHISLVDLPTAILELSLGLLDARSIALAGGSSSALRNAVPFAKRIAVSRLDVALQKADVEALTLERLFALQEQCPLAPEIFKRLASGDESTAAAAYSSSLELQKEVLAMHLCAIMDLLAPGRPPLSHRRGLVLARKLSALPVCVDALTPLVRPLLDVEPPVVEVEPLTASAIACVGAFDVDRHADAIARHLGSSHHTCRIAALSALAQSEQACLAHAPAILLLLSDQRCEDTAIEALTRHAAVMHAHGERVFGALQRPNWRSTLRLMLVCLRNCPEVLEQPPHFAAAVQVMVRQTQMTADAINASFLASLTQEQAAASATVLARLVDDAASHAASSWARWRFESIVHLRTLPVAALAGCVPVLEGIASRDPDVRVCAAARNALRKAGQSVPALPGPEPAGPACRCLQPKCECGAPSRQGKPPALFSVQQQVLAYFKQAGETAEAGGGSQGVGLEVAKIAGSTIAQCHEAMAASGVSLEQIRIEVKLLVSGGHLYSTIDDHYKAV